ncbi:4,5-DOPA dioxygenase extradiol [Olivibacter sp. CPCC 100613]|uniref:4,5-DOPA-extradiol-dioxygenase n=1 Tax=Olivibacter sp. CPCC 100613 TaxID=3079931 RepID=UPI002FF7764D
MNTLSAFNQYTNSLAPNGELMPVLFIGHGSPMNGIEHNVYSENWRNIAKKIPTPVSVLVISAHWLTKGTGITAMNAPKTIHDFGGFPEALYDVQYPAPGNPKLAEETTKLIKKTPVVLDHDWGLDHGAWTVVRHMYPLADIPVLQLSIDYTKDAAYHYDLGAQLYALRKRGVLIIGSGNMVHNLRMVSWQHMHETNYGYDWAVQMNNTFKDLITNGDHAHLIRYEQLGKEASLAIPTPDHYYPLIYTLALQGKKDEAHFFNDYVVGGSLTMTSVIFSEKD